MSSLIGKKAPAFNLKNQNGEKVSVKSFIGEKNVVIYFYPKAMTPGCTVQAKSLKEVKAKYSRKDTVIIGMSPDPVAKLKKFEEKYKLNFDLLSDEDHKIADKYQAWGPKQFMGKKYDGILRSTFIINKEGKIVHHMPKVKTKTHHDDVLSWIKENL